jgi:hypothetical protein
MVDLPATSRNRRVVPSRFAVFQFARITFAWFTRIARQEVSQEFFYAYLCQKSLHFTRRSNDGPTTAKIRT